MWSEPLAREVVRPSVLATDSTPRPVTQPASAKSPTCSSLPLALIVWRKGAFGWSVDATTAPLAGLYSMPSVARAVKQ